MPNVHAHIYLHVYICICIMFRYNPVLFAQSDISYKIKDMKLHLDILGQGTSTRLLQH